jgi:hypothetical protein
MERAVQAWHSAGALQRPALGSAALGGGGSCQEALVGSGGYQPTVAPGGPGLSLGALLRVKGWLR